MNELDDLVRDVITKDDHDHWATLTSLGLTLVGIDEEDGGSGGSLAEVVEIARSLARYGATTPFAEHHTACWALTGRTVPDMGTVAFGETRDAHVRLRVPWGSHASDVVVLLEDDTAAHLDTSAAEVVIESGTDVAGRPLDEVTAPTTALTTLDVNCATVSARLALLRAAAIVGAAHGAYAQTRDHVRSREQFGRPLLKVPAVSTSLARFRVEIIQSETALAAALADAEAPAAHEAAAAARVVCGATATEAARIAHQLHGALGITAEYGLHTTTRALWALRDADRPEEYWATVLGERVLDSGEAHLWEVLTVVAED